MTDSAGARAVQVSTVDGFQGREVDVVLFSCVRAPPEGSFGGGGGWGGIGFLSDRRRMNVAITRARRSLVILGHARRLVSDGTWKALVHHAETRGRLVADVSSRGNSGIGGGAATGEALCQRLEALAKMADAKSGGSGGATDGGRAAADDHDAVPRRGPGRDWGRSRREGGRERSSQDADGPSGDGHGGRGTDARLEESRAEDPEAQPPGADRVDRHKKQSKPKDTSRSSRSSRSSGSSGDVGAGGGEPPTKLREARGSPRDGGDREGDGAVVADGPSRSRAKNIGSVLEAGGADSAGQPGSSGVLEKERNGRLLARSIDASATADGGVRQRRDGSEGKTGRRGRSAGGGDGAGGEERPSKRPRPASSARSSGAGDGGRSGATGKDRDDPSRKSASKAASTGLVVDLLSMVESNGKAIASGPEHDIRESLQGDVVRRPSGCVCGGLCPAGVCAWGRRFW